MVPVHRQLLADHLTPVTAFELLGRADDHAFLLESVVGGEKIARYSFIATRPAAVYQATGPDAVTVRNGETTRARTADPLADLAALLPARRFHRDPKLPTFTGGLVGYAGYDAARYYEPDRLTTPRPTTAACPTSASACTRSWSSSTTSTRRSR